MSFNTEDAEDAEVKPKVKPCSSTFDCAQVVFRAASRDHVAHGTPSLVEA